MQHPTTMFHNAESLFQDVAPSCPSAILRIVVVVVALEATTTHAKRNNSWKLGPTEELTPQSAEYQLQEPPGFSI